MAREEGARQIGLGTVVLFGLVACLLYGVPAGLRGDVGIVHAQDLVPVALAGVAYRHIRSPSSS